VKKSHKLNVLPIVEYEPKWLEYSIALFLEMHMLRGIAYNSSNKGKSENTNDIVTTESTENCESKKVNTEVENDKKVSFDNVTNVD